VFVVFWSRPMPWILSSAHKRVKLSRLEQTCSQTARQSSNILNPSLRPANWGALCHGQSRVASKLRQAFVLVFFALAAVAAMHAQNATPVSVSPSAPSGSQQMFTATYTDPNGGADVQSASLYIMNGVVPGSTGWSANECVLLYTISSGVIQLAQDSGGEFLATTAAAGTSGTVSNSQCAVLAAASSATVSGNTVTVNLFVTFTPAFSGAKQLYMSAVDNEGNFSTNFQTQFGAYTVTSTLNPVSVSPSSASGSGQMFAATYSDTTSIQQVLLGFNSMANSIATPNQCWLRYDVATGAIWLMPDAATSWGPSSISAGSSQTLSNSQCTVIGSASSAAVSGSTLTVNFDVTFTSLYAGVKQIDLQGEDVNGNWTTNEKSYGTYTITIPNNSPPPPPVDQSCCYTAGSST
jgi:hypothetical protein